MPLISQSAPNVSPEKPISERSNSPSSSRGGSPRPSPKAQNNIENHLIRKEQISLPSFKFEGSTSPESSGSGKVASVEVSSSDFKQDLRSCGREKGNKGKKKTSWFNFYPTYKSKSEDFKRLFREVPDDERLVVDYSCALQKEILVQGRLYVTQNYLCFYANIFGWETNMFLKWKEVAAITKEKTALVIPNAILICTKSEKYFLTSFVARDKTYLMLFRVWQNALMEQPMSSQEMWQWVHQCYGDELGLTSDDEDYISPNNPDEDRLSTRLSTESFSEAEAVCFESTMEDKLEVSSKKICSSFLSHISEDTPFCSDHTDNSESDADNIIHKKCVESVNCTAPHNGRLLLNEVVSVPIDQLFTLLFTSSKFYLDFHAARKTQDLTQTPWTYNPIDNCKSRVVNLTMALSQTLGPKSSNVTESQVMLPCSKAGHLYSIDIETVNAGIPYADSFIVLVHYCLQKISTTQSSISVYAQIKYRKNVFSFVKGMIERNCWAGLNDFFQKLKEALFVEEDENTTDVKRKSRIMRRLHSIPQSNLDDKIRTGRKRNLQTNTVFNSDVCTVIVLLVLSMLLILNMMLYYKLWSLEEIPYSMLDMEIMRKAARTHEDWIKLLQRQEAIRVVEAHKWQKILRASIKLLKQTEESLNELQNSIQPTYMNKIILSLIQSRDSGEGSKDEL